jgi:cyclophilin family peptidyl-prolyl cis-trans isomerase
MKGLNLLQSVLSFGLVFHLSAVVIGFQTTSSVCNRNFATSLSAQQNENKDIAAVPSWKQPSNDFVGKAFAASLLSAFLWSSPVVTTSSSQHNGRNIITFGLDRNVASAKEMASGSGSRVNKDPESLLRYGLPIDNQEVRNLQGLIERIRFDVTSKRMKFVSDGMKKSRVILNKSSNKLTSSCQDQATCKSIIGNMVNDLDKLEDALSSATSSLSGSDQEREALVKVYAADDDLLKQLTALEEQMIPNGYKPTVPAEYSDMPQLLGRATVEMLLKKPDGSPFNVEGELFKEAKLKMVIDGYNAPITGGNFVELIQKGFYTKMAIQRSDGFVVQTGKPAGGVAEGYVGTPGKATGAGPHGERLIPLEIMMKGDKTPIYSSTMEDEGRGGEATVLPFSSFGAMGWAREEYEPNSGSSQFFWLLFDSDLTPAGKNVLDGRYPCFGYVVEGAELLRDIKEGDVIVTATVTSGIENLVLPKA